MLIGQLPTKGSSTLTSKSLTAQEETLDGLLKNIVTGFRILRKRRLRGSLFTRKYLTRLQNQSVVEAAGSPEVEPTVAAEEHRRQLQITVTKQWVTYVSGSLNATKHNGEAKTGENVDEHEHIDLFSNVDLTSGALVYPSAEITTELVCPIETSLPEGRSRNPGEIEHNTSTLASVHHSLTSTGQSTSIADEEASYHPRRQEHEPNPSQSVSTKHEPRSQSSDNPSSDARMGLHHVSDCRRPSGGFLASEELEALASDAESKLKCALRNYKFPILQQKSADGRKVNGKEEVSPKVSYIDDDMRNLTDDLLDIDLYNLGRRHKSLDSTPAEQESVEAFREYQWQSYKCLYPRTDVANSVPSNHHGTCTLDGQDKFYKFSYRRMPVTEASSLKEDAPRSVRRR